MNKNNNNAILDLKQKVGDEAFAWMDELAEYLYEFRKECSLIPLFRPKTPQLKRNHPIMFI